MATFTNQATLTYNGQTTTSNVTVGELTETLTAAKTAVVPTYGTDGRVTIRRGSHLGQIVIKIDSAKFLADASRTLPKFVIPLRLTDVQKFDSGAVWLRYSC